MKLQGLLICVNPTKKLQKCQGRQTRRFTKQRKPAETRLKFPNDRRRIYIGSAELSSGILSLISPTRFFENNSGTCFFGKLASSHESFMKAVSGSMSFASRTPIFRSSLPAL